MESYALINGLIKVENTAALIYSNLIRKFPEQKEFWDGLLNDEREHISFLTDVKSVGLTKELQNMDLPPSMYMINETLKLAGGITEIIKETPIPFKDALSMTLKLEESTVETYTNQLITKLLSCEDETSYKKLVTDEKAHVEKIRSMMEEAQ